MFPKTDKIKDYEKSFTLCIVLCGAYTFYFR